MKKTLKRRESLKLLFIALLVSLFTCGCHRSSGIVADDFIGTTRVEIIDDLHNPTNEFEFLLFTTTSITEVEAFRDSFIRSVTIHRCPDIYLYQGDERTIGVMYEVHVEVKPVPCRLTSLKMSFDKEVKDITFGHYEIRDAAENTEAIDALVNCDPHLTDESDLYNMVLLVYNNHDRDIIFEKVETINPIDDAFPLPVIAPIPRETILAFNIKRYPNISLRLPKDVYQVHGLLNLSFKSNGEALNTVTDYLINALPNYYILKETGIDLATLISN